MNNHMSFRAQQSEAKNLLHFKKIPPNVGMTSFKKSQAQVRAQQSGAKNLFQRNCSN